MEAAASTVGPSKRSFDAVRGTGEPPDTQPDAQRARHENPYNGQPYSENYYRLLAQRRHLPMYDNRDTVLNAILQHKIVLVVGETGSGKSTQLPQLIVERLSNRGQDIVRLVCTQPRRVAAMSLAQRVADEMDVKLGDEVGYAVRFEARRSDKTQILFATDGMLLRDAMKDPMLSQYRVIVVDEAHERSISTDILVGLIRLNILKRPDVHIVIMSATLDVQKFQKTFPQAATVRVPGRVYPVKIFYTSQPVKDYVLASVQHAWHIHQTEEAGDILCFLIGEAEIEAAVQQLQAQIRRAEENNEVVRPASVRALYGALSLEDQRRVFAPARSGERRIIFSTNIAETSLTIDGVVYVIDSGFCKQHSYRPDTKLDCIVPTVISKAAAEQRAGRAGRTRPGKCYRLFCEKDLALLPDHTYPEVQRSNLTDVCLTLLKLGISNIIEFPFLDIPAPSMMADALTQLNYLEAVDDDMILTDFGKLMAEFPLDANASRMLLRSPVHGCSAEMAVVAAMMNAGNVFFRPFHQRGAADEARDRIAHRDGDHLSLYNIFMLFLENHKSPQYCKQAFLSYRSLSQAERIYYQLVQMMTARDIPFVSCVKNGSTDWRLVDSVAFRRAVLEGYFTKVAYLPKLGDRYVLIREQTVSRIHPSSQYARPHAPKPRWVMFRELELTGEEGPAMKIVSPVEVEWLLAVHPEFFCPDEVVDGEAAEELRSVQRRATPHPTAPSSTAR